MFEIGKAVSKSMEADSLIFSTIPIDVRVDLLKLASRSLFGLDGQTLVLPKPNERLNLHVMTPRSWCVNASRIAFF
jgi:hypothetical protein